MQRLYKRSDYPECGVWTGTVLRCLINENQDRDRGNERKTPAPHKCRGSFMLIGCSEAEGVEVGEAVGWLVHCFRISYKRPRGG